MLVAAALGGCTATGGGGSGDASCASTIVYRGEDYGGVYVEVEPCPGKSLGTAFITPCNDTNGADESGERVEVARLPGASPKRALVVPGDVSTVYVRQKLGPTPDAVRRLFDAPACDDRDGPVRLFGTWLGILGADENTEVDLVPPYDVTLRVAESSPDVYERAEISVRVPKTLGTPLTRQDLGASLRAGGDIEIEAGCRESRFLARAVEALPPR